MWISEKTVALLESVRAESVRWQNTAHILQGELDATRAENVRLNAEREWFKHRLNQVEMERAMLMQDRIGVKISVPQFVPAMDDPSEALSKVVDISTIGGDAKEDFDTDADPTQNPGVDYTNLPGYGGKRRR